MASSDEQVADIEKGPASDVDNSRLDSSTEKEQREVHDPAIDIDELIPSENIVIQWTKRVEHFLALEARGIHRVKSNEQSPKTTLSFLQIVVLWFSINTASQNITLASIGQGVYGLGFVDATLTSIFGAIVGSIPVAYTAGWGPWSGNRTMVRTILFLARFFRYRNLADSLSDLCPLLNGMVASEDLRSPESSRPDWILYDRCCCSWPNSLGSISQWQSHCGGGYCDHRSCDLAGNYFWYQDISSL
jgi:hypothetical protein